MLKVLFLILVVMSSAIFAQAQENKQAYKFFEYEKISDKLLNEKLESFCSEINNTSWVGWIITYGSQNEITKSEEQVRTNLRKTLSCRKEFPSPRIIYTDFGNDNKSKIFLWIAPPGKTPSDFLNEETSETEPTARKFAEIGIVSDEELKNKIDEVDEITNKNPSDTVYIITYGTIKEISERERKIRDSIILRRYDSMRLVLLSKNDGGNLRTEFWLVPYGTTPPTP